MTRQRILFSVGVAIAVAMSAGCGDKKSDKCKVGEVHDCTCPNHYASLQSCNADGTWAACMCGQAPTAGAGESGTNAAGTTAGGGGTSGTVAGTGTGDDAGATDGSTTEPMGDGGTPMTDGATAPGEDAAVVDAYSSCKSATCPMGETCDATGKFCTRECAVTADCPDPVDGKATKICVGALAPTKGKCALSCDALVATCPTNMVCAGFPIIGMSCAWP